MSRVIGYDYARRLSVAGIIAYVLTCAAILVAACVTAGCGGAQQVGEGAACASLLTAIGEHRGYDAERAEADISTVREVCDRLAAVDAGAP